MQVSAPWRLCRLSFSYLAYMPTRRTHTLPITHHAIRALFSSWLVNCVWCGVGMCSRARGGAHGAVSSCCHGCSRTWPPLSMPVRAHLFEHFLAPHTRTALTPRCRCRPTAHTQPSCTLHCMRALFSLCSHSARTLHSPLSTLHSPLSTLHSPLSTLHCMRALFSLARGAARTRCGPTALTPCTHAHCIHCALLFHGSHTCTHSDCIHCNSLHTGHCTLLTRLTHRARTPAAFTAHCTHVSLMASAPRLIHV
jgi:hypothetical protein